MYVFIIAGSYSQYVDYLKTHSLNPSMFVYLHKQEQLYGRQGALYMLAGEYWLNPVYDKGLSLLDAYNFKEIQIKAKETK